MLQSDHLAWCGYTVWPANAEVYSGANSCRTEREIHLTKTHNTCPGKKNTGIVTSPAIPITFSETTTSTESEQDVEYSSSNTDEFSDSGDDYVCPELNTKGEKKYKITFPKGSKNWVAKTSVEEKGI